MSSAHYESRPSQVRDDPYLHAFPDSPQPAADPSMVGKWMVFAPRSLVDVEWRVVRRATREGRLGSEAKVATRFENPLARNPDEQPIMIYTRDWRDQADVERVIAALRAIGIDRKAFYKRDEDTRQGRYGDGVTIYVSPPGAAWFDITDPSINPTPTAEHPRVTAEPARPARRAPRLLPLDAWQTHPAMLDAADALSQPTPPRARERLPLTLPGAVMTAFAHPETLLESGAEVRLHCDAYDPEDGPARLRRRTFPTTGSPGIPLTPEAVTRIVNAVRDMGADKAAEVFLEEFGDSYGFWPEVRGVGWLHVWAPGMPEPE
jgi:hypothetical protein